MAGYEPPAPPRQVMAQQRGMLERDIRENTRYGRQAWRPYCQVQKTGTQSINNATFTYIAWQIDNRDTEDAAGLTPMYDPTVNFLRLRIPYDGLYAVTVTFNWDSATQNGTITHYVVRNQTSGTPAASNTFAADAKSYIPPTFPVGTIHSVAEWAGGDTVALCVHQNIRPGAVNFGGAGGLYQASLTVRLLNQF